LGGCEGGSRREILLWVFGWDGGVLMGKWVGMEGWGRRRGRRRRRRKEGKQPSSPYLLDQQYHKPTPSYTPTLPLLLPSSLPPLPTLIFPATNRTAEVQNRHLNSHTRISKSPTATTMTMTMTMMMMRPVNKKIVGIAKVNIYTEIYESQKNEKPHCPAPPGLQLALRLKR